MAFKGMFQRPPDEPTDFLTELDQCWRDSSDEQFERFLAAWHLFLTADLAQFTRKPAAVAQVSRACRDEYRAYFGARHDPQSDYPRLFRAIAYSHFSHSFGDRGVRQFIRVAGSSPLLDPDSNSPSHELCIVVFAVLLSLGHACAAQLLDVCFDLREEAAEGCSAVLRQRLAGLSL